MSEGFNISRGSLPGWLSSAALVLGIVGYFFYERTTDVSWRVAENLRFDSIDADLAALKNQLSHVRAAVSEHRGEHKPLPHPPADRHPP